MLDNTIISISRQYGSGGKELSDILAKKLGIKCYIGLEDAAELIIDYIERRQREME